MKIPKHDMERYKKLAQSLVAGHDYQIGYAMQVLIGRVEELETEKQKEESRVQEIQTPTESTGNGSSGAAASSDPGNAGGV